MKNFLKNIFVLVRLQDLESIPALLEDQKMQMEDFMQSMEEGKNDMAAIKNEIKAMQTQMKLCSERVEQLQKRLKNIEESQNSQPSLTEIKPQVKTTQKSSSVILGISSSDNDKKNADTPIVKKEYYSDYVGNSFAPTYLISDESEKDSFGYYEVLDFGNSNGAYQPNMKLQKVLMMNVSSMLEPLFDIDEDGSEMFTIVSQGEVVKEGNAWKITKKGRISI